MTQVDFDILESLYHHLVLPPKLPGKAENDLHIIEKDLLRRLIQAVDLIKRALNNEAGNEYNTLKRCLDVCDVVNEDSRLKKSSLLGAFQELDQGDSLILHIKEQNASLLIQREGNDEDAVTFEAFETSPKASSVLAAKNALQWQFPGSAVSIASSVFGNASFQANLASFLEQASLEPLHRFAAYARKAGVDVVESRDTTDPSIITSMLMTLLEANGSRSYPQLLCKRVRDDVCWESSERPWRRSSFWLVLRVSMQRTMCSMFGSEIGHAHYKFLICVLLSRLLRDSFRFPFPEMVDNIKAKVSRRLAKLEDDKVAASAISRQTYERLFTVLGPIFSMTLTEANEHVSTMWDSFKKSISRHIPLLPRRAQDSDLQLQLSHSSPYVQKVLSIFQAENYAGGRFAQHLEAGSLNVVSVTSGAYKDLVDRHYAVANLELKIEDIDSLFPATTYDQEKLFGKLTNILVHYLNASFSSYERFPEHMGNFLLNVFTMWVRVDMCATKVFPLLLEYHPGFDPELLNVVQLSSLQDMFRLQSVQKYIRKRCENAKVPQMTIFADPVKGCFAERYFDQPENFKTFLKLKITIERASNSAKTQKEQQYQTKCNEYDNFTRKMSCSSCTMKRLETGEHDIRGCNYCFFVRSRKKIKIMIHEDYLPNDEVAINSIYKKAIVFELAMPDMLKKYRDITWKLLLSLTYPEYVKKANPPEILLRDYGPLLSYKKVESFEPANFCLASYTKPFTATHYKEVRFPTEFSRVCYPHGLKYSYYDVEENVWAKDLPKKQTLGHYFQLSAGVETPLTNFCSTNIFSPENDGPSSNEIIASESMCPAGHNVNEFMAYQSLFSGRERRWFALLLELGSSNLSFSSEHTMFLINRLAREAGPANIDDPLRVVHQVFRDHCFCEALLGQVKQHVQGIASNWRESYYMNMLITLALRSYELGDDHVKPLSLAALKEIRKYTWSWLALLQHEADNVKEAAAAYTISRYALWASLLCRRTFHVYVDQINELDEETISIFIEATISMQANLVDFSDTHSKVLQNMLIDDIKLMPRIRDLIHKSIDGSPESLNSTIDKFWPQPLESSTRIFSNWQNLEACHQGWMVAKVDASQVSAEQVVHFNYLQGHLLIDGKSIGILPATISDNFLFKELFGDQKLRTIPSGMSGMSHMLAKRFDGHQVHIGFRDGKLIIRACVYNNILELLEKAIFGSGKDLDLPEALLDNCTHWLNLKTGIVDIRRQPQVWWCNRDSNWKLDFKCRQAYRRRVTLVDPHSRLFERVTGIFKFFEQEQRLTVYQPSLGNLTVEMKHLDLSFSVLPTGLLFSRHLGSEIDPNQDAGTFYGLLSKIVLRDKSNYQRRSIIVPQGPVRYKRHGIHVLSRIENRGSYSRYAIDDVLGRLCCPPEPRLLYAKALLHAVTSFPVVDDLTRLTGVEEALRCLRSGFCQPWTTLGHSILEILEQIGRLTPTRQYYPKQLKRQQTVSWDTNLTVSIQDDRFRVTVEAIFAKVDRLSVFSESKVKPLNLDMEHIPHLCLRSQLRRRQLERCEPFFEQQNYPSDIKYTARDCSLKDCASQNVFEMVSLLRFKPTSFATTSNLARKLEGALLIGGYQTFFDKCLSASLCEDIMPLWGSIVNSCISDQVDTYDLMFQLSPLAFAEVAEIELIRTLIAFRLFDDLRVIELPSQSSFAEFRPNEHLSMKRLREIINSYCRPFDTSYQFSYALMSHRDRKKVDKAKREHNQSCSEAVDELVKSLLHQWPCEKPTIDNVDSPHINIDEALGSILPLWERLYHNLELSRHIETVQSILNSKQNGPNFSKPSTLIGQSLEISRVSRQTLKASVSLREMLNKVAIDPVTRLAHHDGQTMKNYPRAETRKGNLQQIQKVQNTSKTLEQDELETIIHGFADSDCMIRRQYGVDLQHSLDALKSTPDNLLLVNEYLSLQNLTSEIRALQKIVCNYVKLLQDALERKNIQSRWLRQGGLWPCITRMTLLEQLRSTAKTKMPKCTKEAIVSLGILITTLQRSLRLKDALGKNKISDIEREQRNHGHRNWQPIKYPDWLLFEIESDLLIRKEQVDVAHATIWPESMSNSVLQMNMGQGKTSCVLPMVAALLANGSQLCRIVVPKALLPQTAQILQTRLGDLLGREISHVPFSRRSPTGPDAIEVYNRIHQDALESCGIILTLPEHILSFKLSGIQMLAEKRLTEATEMIRIQNWMAGICRDILDECDFTLATRTQLIYPSGTRAVVDGQADRWKCIQLLLELIEMHIWILQQKYPKSIKIKKRDGTEYSMISFLRSDVEDALIFLLVEDVCRSRVPILTKDKLKDINLEALRKFIMDENISPRLTLTVCKECESEPQVKKIIFLLRGLFAHRLLILCLKKRWNVQYGIHPNRDPVAVPFEAKGIPSEQNEWGQPDVAIIFTCLSFYYSGLNPNQLLQGLKYVLKADDPATEYDRWIHNCASLPPTLRHWNAINLEDEGQITQIHSHLRYNLTVINHFLNLFVFPNFAKQFSTKLQASGWDIPLFSKSTDGHYNNERTAPDLDAFKLTTGFSGTNDNRRILPLTIRQNDLPGLSHTNAEVLTYLLQSRNRTYKVIAQRDGQQLSEYAFLQLLHQRKIRLLIDAGAYILEMDNKTLVRAWLEVDHEAQAAVFFDSSNKAWVLHRNGKSMPLLASPFADRLGNCLVYLDQAHTRGTDLKLPLNAHGALTVGLGQTKDHTVQAAMRLRQLGSTQQITFFAPPEVHQSILDFCQKESNSTLDSADVISWLLEQTCNLNEQHLLLYFSQGMDFCKRTDAFWRNPNSLQNPEQRENYLNAIKQREQLGLEDLYKPRYPNDRSIVHTLKSPQLCHFTEVLRGKRPISCASDSVVGSVLEQVEQEREIAHEVEQVREVEKPIHFQALPVRKLDPGVWNFAMSGNIPDPCNFDTAFASMRKTELGVRYGLSETTCSPRLFVSPEYPRTVRTAKCRPNDNFLRPVNWLIWSPHKKVALIITPEEAEMIIPMIRIPKWPLTHLIVYAAPVTKMMLHFDSLNYYSLPSLPRDWKPPRWLTVELGLFSGRLYIGIDEYTAVLKYLEQDDQNDTNRAMNYINTQEQGMLSRRQGKSTFSTSEPLNFLQDWLAVRRKGQDISYTPMGYVCQGRQIPANHPFFSSTNAPKPTDPAGKTTTDSATCKGKSNLTYSRALMVEVAVGKTRQGAGDSDDFSGESEDDFDDDDAENAGDVDLDEQGNRFTEDGSSESSL